MQQINTDLVFSHQCLPELPWPGINCLTKLVHTCHHSVKVAGAWPDSCPWALIHQLLQVLDACRPGCNYGSIHCSHLQHGIDSSSDVWGAEACRT